MKLYTEEQVKNFLKERTFIREETIDAMCDTLTPIELPSDEDMANASNHCKDGQVKVGFLRGVLWMIDKIQGGNK